MLYSYCTPLSVAAGERLSVHVSASFGVRIEVIRAGSADDPAIGEFVHVVEPVAARVQRVPDLANRFGCGWPVSWSMTIPDGWRSGIYTARCRGGGEVFDATFVVRATPALRGDIVLLANTNTWTAYNEWADYEGSRESKYVGNTPCSFERPNPAASLMPNGDRNHLARGELWILNWLEGDLDSGDVALTDYRVAVLSTHPEYWTFAMVDRLRQFLDQGGSLLYLAGNGVFERCEFTVDRRGLDFFLDGDNEHRPNNWWRNLDRPERDLLGVAYRNNNASSTPTALHVLNPGHRFLIDTSRPDGSGLQAGDPLGATGRNRVSDTPAEAGAASGWEMDTSAAADAPAGVVVNAYDPSQPLPPDDDGWHLPPSDRGRPPGGIDVIARGANTGQGPHAADVTAYRHPGGGLVFAAGAIPFGGALVDDTNLQTLVLNALDEGLGHFDPSGTRYAHVWVASDGRPFEIRHGQPEAEFRQSVRDFTDTGFYPTAVWGYQIAGAERYASIWEPADGLGWRIHWGQPEPDFRRTFEELKNEGFQPIQTQGHVTPDRIERYTSVWTVSDGREWAAHWGQPEPSYRDTFEQCKAQGLRPHQIQGFVTADGIERINSLWHRADGPAWEVHHSQSEPAFRESFSILSSRGYQPRAINGHTLAGQERYCSIWEADDRGWRAAWGQRGGAYQRAANRFIRTGFRPVSISGYAP